MHKYSHFFETLHDEQNPIGHLGRGTHYSVLRAITFHDAMGRALSEGRFCDFAVIWDEDHDERVIGAIETVYRNGLLAPFIVFGERKANFTAIFGEGLRDAKRQEFLKSQIEKIAEDVDGDSWVGYVNSLGSEDNPIISDSDDRVQLYLANIKMLWELGLNAPPRPSIVRYHVVFHPMSAGVSPGNRGGLAEISVPYPSLEAAVSGRDNAPPRSGYIAVKIVDDAGKIYRERTAGHHVALSGMSW
jgi:hypothetical protein